MTSKPDSSCNMFAFLLKDMQLSTSHEEIDSDSTDMSTSPKNGHNHSSGPQNADSGAHSELSYEHSTI